MVVLDGLAFQRPGEGEAVASAADEAGAFVATVVCDVPVEVAAARAEADAAAGAHRAANRDGPAVRRVAAEMREPAGDYLTVDTRGPVDEAAELVLAYLRDVAR
jgi:predicted kinase